MGKDGLLAAHENKMTLGCGIDMISPGCVSLRHAALVSSNSTSTSPDMKRSLFKLEEGVAIPSAAQVTYF